MKFLRRKIYHHRGYYSSDHYPAVSWTSDYSVAKKFSERFSKNGTIAKMDIRKKDILAYISERDEDEYIVDIRKY